MILLSHTYSYILVIYETFSRHCSWLQWSHSLLRHCGLHNGLSFTSLTLCVAQWFLLFVRHCRWLQWSLNSFITLYTIITSDGETRYNLSIPLDFFTPRKLMFSEHFCTLFRIDTNYIKDYLYTLDFSWIFIPIYLSVISYLYKGYLL